MPWSSSAADTKRVEDLERGVAEYLAWRSVDRDAGPEGLNLDPAQAAQARTKVSDGGETVALRMRETYQWLLVPTQPEPTGPIAWDVLRVDGPTTLAVRAAKKLTSDGLLAVAYPPALLRQRLNGELNPLWEHGHTTVASLWAAFSRYLYLPRLRDLDVLIATVATGPGSLAWSEDSFATADAHEAGRYVGLTAGGFATAVNTDTMIVRPDVAAAQLASEKPPGTGTVETGGDKDEPIGPGKVEPVPASGAPRRFHGSVELAPERLTRDFGRVAQEVISQLSALLGTKVDITVEISATYGDGFPDQVVRAVSENAKTLKFTDFAFEDS